MMKEGSNAKHGKVCIEDRISGLSDEILCHILSFLSTKDAVKTSALSHRWTDVWTSVPSLDLAVTSLDEGSVGFVDRVLFFRGSSNIHKLRLECFGLEEYISRLDAWISAARRRNVVELDLDLNVDDLELTECKLSSSILKCKKLVVLKLHLQYTSITITPSSNCFPCLRFLLVKVFHPMSHTMESLFSCCPVLEDLVIDIEYGDSVLCFDVSAPKLKRLQITSNVYSACFYFLMRKNSSKININAPNLEELDLWGNFFVTYSLYNVKSLSKVNIDVRPTQTNIIHMEDLPSYLDFVVDSANADLVHKLFTVVQNVEYLSLSAPIFGDPRTLKEYDLPRFCNLKHLDLLLEACCSWEFLTKLLSLSPNLECLVLESNIKCSLEHLESHLNKWCMPDCVPICLLRLKTICIRGFQGRPDEMEMVEYFLKHGEGLSNVTIHNSDICGGISMQHRARLMARLVDQTCGEVEFTTELTEAMLLEKFDDDKRNGKEFTKYVKDLEDCTMKWHEKKMPYLLEEERLRILIDLAEKKCTDADTERKKKVDELEAISSHLRQRIATLGEELAKIESEKMDATNRCRREREARETLQISLLGKLEQLQEEKLFAEQRASELEDDLNQKLEYNRSLQEYNSELEIDFRTLNEASKRAEMERLTKQIIVE